MNNINGINSYQGPDRIRPELGKNQDFTKTPVTESTKSDQVEISQMARLMGKIADLPEIRTDKVNTIRQQLADGSYDMESKLPIALDRMLNEYMGNP
jgi:flagellar biosynthesis anti-sigma factor FlgM